MSTQHLHSTFTCQKSLSRLEKYALPVDPSSPTFWGLLKLKRLYGPRSRVLGPTNWHFYRWSGFRFGSKLGPEPGTTPAGPRAARTAGPKKVFFRVCLSRILDFWQTKKNRNASARFSRGLFFSLFSPGSAGVRGPKTRAKTQNSKNHFPALKILS